MKGKKANLMIIGTQKAGTTSLFHYLKQHPDLYFSEVKELTYFVDDDCYKRGEDYFHSFFRGHKNEKIIASSYVHMLPCEYCPDRVKKYNPDMKFIIMLRNPVDRAYSAYNYALKNGWESESVSFEESFRLEPKRHHGSLTEKFDLAYFSNGLYAAHINRWYQHFPEKNFLILLDTDLYKKPEETFKSIFSFLEIDPSFVPDTSGKFNQAGGSRSKTLQKLILTKDSKILKALGKFIPAGLRVFIRKTIFSNLTRLNTTDAAHESLKDELREKFNEYFRADIKELSTIINRDLESIWQKKTA